MITDNVLGSVTLPWMGNKVKATLLSNGRWECGDRMLLRHLEALYPYSGWWLSPSQGAPGAALLHHVAQEMEGESHYGSE